MTRLIYRTAPTLLSLALVGIAPVAAQTGLFTVDRYSDIERISAPQISPDGNHVVFVRAHADMQQDRWVSMLWQMEGDGSRQRQLVEGTNAVWSPDGTRIAYLADAAGKSQLWVRYMDAEGAVVQVTRGERPPLSFRWSPDGRTIAFTMAVPDTGRWSIAMPAPPAGATWTPAPRVVTRLNYRADQAGFLADTWTHLFVVAAEGGAPRQVTHGAFNIGERALGIPAPPALDWLLDGKTLIVDGDTAHDADRHYRTSNLYAIDINSGAIRQLTSDRGDWHTPVVSPDGKWIAYTGFASSPDAYHASDLYVMHPDGSAVRALTTGMDRDPTGAAWTDNETLLFAAESAGTVNSWTATLGSKPPFYRPASNGVHVLSLGSFSIKAGVGVATRSTSQFPAEVVRYTVKKPQELQQLTHVNDGVIGGLRLGDIEQIDFGVGDTKLQGWVVKPPGFDPQRHYPMILEIHGGPFSMYNVGFNPAFQNFAAAGYLVLYVNPRGSTGYGSAFGNAIAKAYPSVDYDDLMAGVNETIGRGWVDTTRMYVGGCSGGGVLSSWVIGHTSRFAAAAVRCPVTDWISFTGETDIPLFATGFFDHPFWEDPTAWLRESPVMYAGNMHTPTVIMTGDLDMRTPMPQSEELYTALQLRGVPTALIRFAGEYHGTTSKPSNWMRTQLYMLSWYGRYPTR